jgi:predicted DNA-binding transcriptional regulator AlpA
MTEPLYPPRGMSRIEAAAYIGVSPSLFDQMVEDGRMPGPKQINTRNVWDRFALDAAFEALPDKNQATDITEWKVAV